MSIAHECSNTPEINLRLGSYCLILTHAGNVSLFPFYCQVHPCLPWRKPAGDHLYSHASHHLSLVFKCATCHAFPEQPAHLDPSPQHLLVCGEIYSLQISFSPPGSPTQACGPVVSDTENQGLKEKPILHCGQECAFTQSSMFHPVTSTQACIKHTILIPPPHCGEGGVFLVSRVMETTNYQAEIIGTQRPQQS